MKKATAGKPAKQKTVTICLNEVKIIDLFDADLKPDLFSETLANYVYVNNQGIEANVDVRHICKKLFKNEYAEATKDELIEIMNVALTFKGYKPFAIDCIKQYFTEKLNEFK